MAIIKTIKDYKTEETIYPITKASAVQIGNTIETVETAINNLNNRFSTITTGSINDIIQNGVYYIGAAVTGKPVGTEATGGMLIVAYQGANNINYMYYPGGLSDSLLQGAYIKSKRGGTWINNGTWINIMSDYMYTYSQTIGTGTLSGYRVGRVCYLTADAIKTSATSGQQVGTTLPKQLWPINQAELLCSYPQDNTYLNIRADGVVTISKANSSSLWGSACYIAQCSNQEII